MITRISLLAAVTTALMTSAAWAQADGLPPGPEHDVVAKACTACHDAGTVTGQHQTAAQWSDTVKQMIGNGAKVAPGDFDKIVTYLARNFGAAAPAAAAPRSKNDVPVYAPLTWQRVEGKPVDTR